MAFNVQGARQAGYSDAEIADHLAEAAKFDAAAARKAGYSDQELISHLADTGPLTFRDKPVDDPALPSVSEYGDIGPTASFNQGPQPMPQPPAPPAAAPVAVGDTVVSANDAARVNAPPANPPITSLTDLRDRIQQGDISTLKSLAPTPNEGWLERGARYGAMVGVHGLATLAQMPLNALIGLGQGPSGALTINPATNTLGLTPEAMTTAQVLTPGGGIVGGRDIQFSGANAFKREAPSTLEQAGVMKPAPVTLEELNAAINRATTTQNQLMPGETPPPSGPAPAPDQARPQSQVAPSAPSFVPPGTPAPILPRINELIRADEERAATRPTEIPPAGARSIDEQGNVTPIQQPPNPIDQPGPPRVAPAADVTAVPDSAWVGTTVDDLGNLVRENAAQGGPASLGAAATPEQLAAMSPSQAKAYRRMAEVNRVVSPIEGEDASIKVPGSIPTEAEAKGDPVVSQQEKLVRDRKPEAYGGPDGRLTKNTNARVQLYDDSTLSDPQIDTLNEQQKAQAKADTAKILAVAKPVDGTPVEAQIRGVLNHPRTSELEDVVKTMQPILKKLYDSDGNLKTDPQAWWGIHDDLMARLAKAKDPLNASGAEKYSFDQLLDAKSAVDGVLNKATDGAFQTFLDNQSKFFQQKNAAILLRDFRAKMINPNNGNIYANKFHRFVTDLAIRRGKPGIDPAMDIPDDLFGKLMDINDDLKRAGRIDLGSPRGSPTNLYFELANGLGIVGAHSIMQAAGGGPVGAAVMQGGINALKNRLANMRLNSLVERSLNYPPPTLPPNPNPPGQFIPPTLRNPMMPPP